MPSRFVSRVAAIAVAAFTFVGLASLLPEPPASGQAVAPATAACDGTDCADSGSGHGSCGLASKAMLSRFQAAISERGAVHSTYSTDGTLAVSGQLNLGLSAAAFEQGVLEDLLDRHGLTLVRALPRLGQAVVRGESSGELLETLGAEPVVRFAEPNYVARVALTPNDPFLQLMPQRSAGVEAAWDVTTGDPAIVIALLDTGIDPAHPDLVNRTLPGYDFVNATNVLTDDNGHGTAMAGIIAAEGQNAEGVVGVAFNCRILPVKVADAMGQASVADVAAGIDYAIQNGARVINLSLGTPLGSQALEDAINRALAAGIVVVASAGNDPIHKEVFPAAYDGVVSATPVSKNGELGYDAVLSTGVDVGAPGEDLVTTLPGDVYGFVSGSSAAAAFTSGVAALVISADPTLVLEQVVEALRQGQEPIAALKDVEDIYRFGSLNAGIAVRRADPTLVDVAVSGLRVRPARPQPGQPATVTLEVYNQGNVALTNHVFRVAHLLNGQRIEIGFQLVDLAVGERREISLPFAAPAANTYMLRAVASTAAGETEINDNTRIIPMVVDPQPSVDLRVVSRTITEPNVATGFVTATVVIENLGTAPANTVTVEGAILPATSTLALAGTPLNVGAGVIGAAVPGGGAPGAVVVPQIAVGARAQVQFTYAIPTPAPTGILRIRLGVQPLAGEVNVADNQSYFDFRLGSTTTLRGLYQQSNEVDIIPDVVWRVDPGRSYVPLQVFVASKGGTSSSTRLTLTHTSVGTSVDPNGPWTPVYDDRFGQAPTVSSAPMVLVDEMGVAQPTLDMFGDRIVDVNGHHQILRIPRSDFGVATNPSQPVDRYLDTKVEWDQERVVYFFFNKTRSGSHRAVTKTRFSSAPFPSLPGDNHYHDVHHHTIAEWYFGSPLDIFAPRKAYGGPLQMVIESAYAMGLLNGNTAQDAYMRLITTDHNSFNNRTTPEPDSADHRPPFGPQSVTANPGVGQLEAYRALFGDCAGEEIAFDQDIPMPSLPLVNNILNMLPGIPLGAHMLLYRANHVEGPWHGGGWLTGPGNPNIHVNLDQLLSDVATTQQATQSESFAYASHPFGGQGWNDANVDRSFGLDPLARTRDAVHPQSGEFVLKGVEYFNGRGTRKLPTAAIDWNNLNPWIDPDFQRGEADWDKPLWQGQSRWHSMLAQTLEYSFVSDPETRLIRKIYQAGGSDAHGDFNFSTGRAATPLNFSATFNVGDEAWYAVRTYCLGDDKAGATPEERWLNAYKDGNTVTTDGPLVSFSLDANGRFDSADLRWHDATSSHEDRDGKIGGEGALDGGYTALVRRGSDAPVFGYRYSSTDEWGAIASVLLYKTEAGNPNPVRSRPSGVLGLMPYDQIMGVNEMALGGANTDLEQPLDAAREGPVTKATAFAMGAYTGGNPDVIDLGTDNFRCYTNPVFAVPYDVATTVSAIDSATGTIPAGALEVRFTFDLSMDPGAYAIELKELDANGDSTGRATAALATLAPQAGSGWADRPGIKNSVLTVVNQAPISLSGAEYPVAGQTSFVVYWADAPRDAAGNALNAIATTFSEQQIGGSGAGGSSTAPVSSSASTAAGSTGTSRGGGSSGGSGCALTPTSGSPASAAWLALLLLVGLGRLRRP